MRCLRHRDWQRLLLCGAKSASFNAAIVVTVRRSLYQRTSPYRRTKAIAESYCHFAVA